MSDDLIPFLFEGQALVRVIVRDAEPWFVAIDVAALLGYAKPEGAVSRHCRKPTTCPLETGGQVRQVNLISEPDVWRLIIKSNLPEAQRIEAWLFEEVLPTIRKTGGYQMPRDEGAGIPKATAPDPMKAQPIPVQLRWLDEVKGVFGVDAAREAYMETSLPVTPSMLNPRQGSLFSYTAVQGGGNEVP